MEPAAIEHEPWIGRNYADGIEGQRLLIAGFSHYGSYSDGHAGAEFTNYVMRTWALKGQIPFFNHIASYFGFASGCAFWDRVAFANTLGTSVGEDIYSFGTEEQRDAVQHRVLRLLAQMPLPPQKAIVFSKKAWPLWPPFTATQSAILRTQIGYEVEYGGYRTGKGQETLAFGLRHPQFASFDRMQGSVRSIIAVPLPRLLRVNRSI